MTSALLQAVQPASAADTAVRVYLDPASAATVTTAAQPLVFARERSELAVNARDYFSLVPIEINRSGLRAYYWFGYVWSTIDRRAGERVALPNDEWVLTADDRPIALRSARGSLRENGLAGMPLPPPGKAAVAVLFAAQPESLSYTARAGELRLHLLRNGQTEEFSLWRDARPALQAFVAELSLGHR